MENERAELLTPATCPLCGGRDVAGPVMAEGRAYRRCGACRARFLDPAARPKPEAERAHYLTHENHPDDPGYRAFLSRLAVPLLERLPPAQEGLDYGCGPGPALAAMLAEAGHEVALYDPFFFPDPAPLTRAYDFVTCTEAIEHFHDPRAEFARLDALLRPGGRLGLMTAFQPDDDRDFARWHYHRDPTHVVFYGAGTLEFIAAGFGWKCEIPAPNVALMRKPAP